MTSRLPALAHRDFVLLWVGNIVSRTGTQMRDVALAWQVYLLTRSEVAVGMLAACRVVPILLLAIAGGVVADAVDRRRLMIVTQAILAGTSVLLALATRGGWASPPLLYLLVGLASTATAFDNPARQSLTVNLLPPDALANGITLGIVGWQTATTIGPAIGGLILARSIEAIYWIDAVSFSGVIVALLVMRHRHPPRVEGSPGLRERISVRAAIEGFRFLLGMPALMWLMAIDFLATFFGGATLLMPFFADQVFHVGPQGLGLLNSAPATGSLLASLVLLWRKPVERQGMAVIVAAALYGLCMALFGVTDHFALALGLLAGAGAADTVSTVVRQVVRQTMTPDALRGRMTSITMMFFMSGPQLGEVEASLVAAATSVRVSALTGGLACVLCALSIGLCARSVRALRANPPKPPAPA
ncbi:MAG: MFS transporter [Polyangiaceae bacterium]